VRLLLTGAGGQLGHYLLRELRGGTMQTVAWSRAASGEAFGQPWVPVDLAADPLTVERAFHAAQPDVVIHTAAMTTVAACHADPELARRVNVEATERLVQLANSCRARFIFVSTDLVFDGEQGSYREVDTPTPKSVYGESKWDAERAVAKYADHVIARMSLLYGPALNGRQAFFDQQLATIRGTGTCTLFIDEWRTPLSFPAAAHNLLELARSTYTGILHLGGPERINRYEMGARMARAFGEDGSNLVVAQQADVEFPEPRPHDVSLDSARWRSLFPLAPWPKLEAAISAFSDE